MVEIEKYSIEKKSDWDSFVRKAKNSTFLFLRDYMDYHADRFLDHSLMFYDDKHRLVALLPANIVEDEHSHKLTLYSHQGLTYGGLITCKSTTFNVQEQCFEALKTMLLKCNITTFVYKQMPSCYHLCPAEEDEYLLWRIGARLSICQISSTILLQGNNPELSFSTIRKKGIRRAINHGFTIRQSNDITDFWSILEQNLRARHDASPVHSLEEMQSLMQKFPDNIKCFVAECEGRAESGTIIYETQQTVHTQYISATEKGRRECANDLLFATLIKKYEATHRYFDFGTSNEQRGKVVNYGLMSQKEGFCARGIAYKQWTLISDE